MEQGVVPPTINLENPDLEAGCDLDYVPNVAYHYPTAADIPKAILSDNLGFGEWPSAPCCQGDSAVVYVHAYCIVWSATSPGKRASFCQIAGSVPHSRLEHGAPRHLCCGVFSQCAWGGRGLKIVSSIA